MSFLFFFFAPLAGGASGGRLGEGESGGRLGRAKAAEDSDKAEVKVGEGCGEGPRGPPENDSSWAFGGLGEGRKWEEEEEAKCGICLRLCSGGWDGGLTMRSGSGGKGSRGEGSTEPDGTSE